MKLTKIAIALVAVLAMSAVVASGASAEFQLESNQENVQLVAEDNGAHVFTVDGQNVTCKKAEFESGIIKTPANTISGVNAKYSNCTAFGFAGATVNMGNCHYDFTTPEQINSHEYTSKAMILCTGANNINVNSSVFGSECSVSIGQNTKNENLSHVIIHNTTNTPKDLTLTITINEIQVTKNKDNGLCPLSGTGTVNNGSYNNTEAGTTVRDKGGADIFIG
ncbi:MAG TPA: hypothetical protein VFU16_06570 [Solirubrobacterales bacterium]|nr:hypothetical protein [Solirubrobacterales bacterium]